MAASSTGERPASPPELPTDIWDQICSHMSKPTLFQLSLVSRSIGSIARRWAYKSLTLEAFGTSVERFAKVARSPELCDLVRELTIDTWIGPDFEYHANKSYKVPVAFLRSLPYLRFFGGLKALHLRFSEFCGNVDDRPGYDIEETWDFRYRVLDTVCHCVAGMWTNERQKWIDNGEGEDVDESMEQIDESTENEVDVNDRNPLHPNPDEGAPSGQVIKLRELTIANLADYHEPRLSAAWEAVLALPSLVDLKLYVATEEDDASPENATFFEEKYSFFGGLPRSWLAPSVADKLQVLSLYYRDYWGWFPKMDFRRVALPRLRVLALGNYVFSHEWQADWVASVGGGRLEELYLDDCPVLYKARQKQPFSSSDPGYPLPEVVLRRTWNIKRVEYPMRWHHVLSRWLETMGSLRVFRMGCGCGWNGAPRDTIEAMEGDAEYRGVGREVLAYRASHKTHRSFACPAPSDDVFVDRMSDGTDDDEESDESDEDEDSNEMDEEEQPNEADMDVDEEPNETYGDGDEEPNDADENEDLNYADGDKEPNETREDEGADEVWEDVDTDETDKDDQPDETHKDDQPGETQDDDKPSETHYEEQPDKTHESDESDDSSISDDNEKGRAAGRWLHGTGIGVAQCRRLQYIKYDIGMGPSPWLSYTDSRRVRPGRWRFERKEGTSCMDDYAYWDLMAAVEARASRASGGPSGRS